MGLHRKHSLSWPITREQWQKIDQEVDAIYRAMRSDDVGGGSTDASDLISGLLPDDRLPNTGVTPGTYGDATHVAQITVDEKGRITDAGNVSTLSATDQVAASVYRSTNQTLTTAVEAALSFDTEHYDAQGLWAIGTPTKLIIPTAADGMYWVNAQVQLGTGFAGTVHLHLYKNGVLVATQSAAGADLASGTESHTVAALLSLVATDYVECKVLLTLVAGGTFDVVGGTNATFFQAMRQAPQAAASTPTAPGLVLLESHTASGSATLDFATRNATGQSGNTFQSDYDEYVIEFVGLVPATTNVGIGLRVTTDGGSSYVSTGSYAWTHWVYGPGGTGQTANTAQTEVRTIGFVNAVNTSTFSVNGFIRVFNPLSTALHTVFGGQINFWDTAPSLVVDMFSGAYSATTAVTGVRVLATSGNLASGTVRIYGVAK